MPSPVPSENKTGQLRPYMVLPTLEQAVLSKAGRGGRKGVNEWQHLTRKKGGWVVCCIACVKTPGKDEGAFEKKQPIGKGVGL